MQTVTDPNSGSGGDDAHVSAQVSYKPVLPFWRIAVMNAGFLGLQFSFGLQQSNMTPIYAYLGASEVILPLLYLAGPVTGLIVQPIIGVLSDKTTSRWGRRTPYFLAGAILCSLSLLAIPFSPVLWVAVALLWVLDAANNLTQQPYRAYISDRLNDEQRPVGFLMQSAFTGLGQTLSYLAPSVFVWLGMNKDALNANGIPLITRVAFDIGAVLSVTTILWSIFSVRELPLTAREKQAIRKSAITLSSTLKDLWSAVIAMPRPMARMIPMMMFQWYAMFMYWQYIVVSLARTFFKATDPLSTGYRDAVLINGQIGAFYNFIAFLVALVLMRLLRRHDIRKLHAACLVAAALSMFVMPHIHDKPLLFIAVIGVGLGWAGLMGNPFAMVAPHIPPERTGVYMGLINVLIVVPMLLQSLTVPLYYHALLGGDARNAIAFAGLLMLLGAAATFFIPATRAARGNIEARDV